MLVNFLLLKKSRHPFLINLNHPNNWMYCTNIAFMTGLLFVPLPGIYHFAYLGLASGHIFIRMMKYVWHDVKRSFRRLIK